MSAIRSYADRRAFGRRPTNQHAVAHVTGRAPLRCVVRDISEGGALLDFGEPVSLPHRLRLVWDGSGEHAECEVRHVQGGNAGVQFICSNGPRIARESIAVSAQTNAAVLAPPAPLLSREQPSSNAGSLVQKFREVRQAAKKALEPAALRASCTTCAIYSVTTRGCGLCRCSRPSRHPGV